jgi:hypothetical protein
VGFWNRLVDRRRGRKRIDEALRLARSRLEASDPRGALDALRPALLGAPNARSFEIAAQALRPLGDRELAELFDRAADAPEDVERAFELGSRLLEGEDAELAAAILTAAMSLAPFDAVLRSEAAIALARAGRPRAVVETLALHPNLADDPGALFEFAWASLLVGDVETASASRAQLASLSSSPRLLDKLDAALARAGLPPSADPPDARDFYFLEHGGLLLDSSGPGAGRYDALHIDGARAGALVSRLAVALHVLWPRPRRVIPATADDEPLARAVADAIAGELAAGGTGRTPAGLLVAGDARTFEELDPQTYRAPDVLTFALTLRWDTGTSHAPDFVGALAKDVHIRGTPLTVSDEDTADLASFVEARRAYLPPSGRHVHTAYLPDAPLPPSSTRE